MRNEGTMLTRKNPNITARFSPEDKEIVEAAAEIAGLDLSTWVRKTLLNAAQDEIQNMTSEILNQRAQDMKTAIDEKTSQRIDLLNRFQNK